MYIYRSGKWNPDQVPYAEMYSMGIKIVEVLALEPKTQVAGVTIICDGMGYGMKQFAGMSIADVKLMMMSMEVRTHGNAADLNAVYSLNVAVEGQLSHQALSRNLTSERISPVVSDAPHSQRPQTAEDHEELGDAVPICQNEGDETR